VILYLDTSALVKRYVREQGSEEVLALIDQAELVGSSFGRAHRPWLGNMECAGMTRYISPRPSSSRKRSRCQSFLPPMPASSGWQQEMLGWQHGQINLPGRFHREAYRVADGIGNLDLKAASAPKRSRRRTVRSGALMYYSLTSHEGKSMLESCGGLC
jgi:hypothetical protein